MSDKKNKIILEIDKDDWDKWVDSCPASELKQTWSGDSLGMVFNNPIVFRKWLKEIPIFKKIEKE